MKGKTVKCACIWAIGLGASSVASAQVSAQTTVYNATECVEQFSFGQTSSQLYYEYNRGSIRNNSSKTAQLTCPLRLEAGRDIDKVEVYYHQGAIYPNSQGRCYVKLFALNGRTIVSEYSDYPALNARSTLSMGPLIVSDRTEPVVGVLSCKLSIGVENEWGIKIDPSIAAYSVSYR